MLITVMFFYLYIVLCIIISYNIINIDYDQQLISIVTIYDLMGGEGGGEVLSNFVVGLGLGRCGMRVVGEGLWRESSVTLVSRVTALSTFIYSS